MKYFTRIVDSMIKFRMPIVIDKRDLKPVYGEVFYETQERFDGVDHGKNAAHDHVKSVRESPVSKRNR